MEKRKPTAEEIVQAMSAKGEGESTSCCVALIKCGCPLEKKAWYHPHGYTLDEYRARVPTSERRLRRRGAANHASSPAPDTFLDSLR